MKKLGITIIVAIIFGILFATPAMANEARIERWENSVNKSNTQNRKCKKIEKKIMRKFKRVVFVTDNVQTDEDVWNFVSSRKGKSYNVVIVLYGQCLNRKGDGKDSCGYYISYRGVKGVKKGSWVFTYLVYSRGNNECDDVIARYDAVMPGGKK